ncbi:MAG TPA: serine/threonine protein kinase [Acidiferrobacteraceae bacterium]|nr:serine/threonine protein kinase [Acidiferrobacteraceae bacterium]
MSAEQLALKPGTRIRTFEIREVLGCGGFGITYKAWDHQLECDVAIKEYLPNSLATRSANHITVTTVTKADEDMESYEIGLEKFLTEARTLAKFRNPSLVGVKQFISENGTAYMVMEYERGESLAETIKSNQGPMPENHLNNILTCLLNGLNELHAHKILHRDIKPANIYIRENGDPVLLDFGSARETLRDRAANQEMTSMVTLGYAPYEQYNKRGRQGPWTDLYSLGATLYYCVTGKKPVDGMDRYLATKDGWPDPLQSAVEQTNGQYSSKLPQIIDWLLRIEIADRPQNTQEVIGALKNENSIPQFETDLTVMSPTKERGDAGGETILLARGGGNDGSRFDISLILGKLQSATTNLLHLLGQRSTDNKLLTGMSQSIAQLHQGQFGWQHALAAAGMLFVLAFIVIPLAITLRINAKLPEFIAQAGKQGTQLDIQIDDVSTSWLGGNVKLNGIRIVNPEGYQSKYLITAEEVLITFSSTFWWASDNVKIDEISVSPLQVSYERHQKSRRSNLIVANKLIQSTTIAPVGDDAVVIAQFNSAGGEIQAISFPKSDKMVTESLPTLSLSNIGVEQPLFTSGAINRILSGIMDRAINTAKSSQVLRRATLGVSGKKRSGTSKTPKQGTQGKSTPSFGDRLKDLLSTPPSENTDGSDGEDL